jgi:hypothetical protein
MSSNINASGLDHTTDVDSVPRQVSMSHAVGSRIHARSRFRGVATWYGMRSTILGPLSVSLGVGVTWTRQVSSDFMHATLERCLTVDAVHGESNQPGGNISWDCAVP